MRIPRLLDHLKQTQQPSLIQSQKLQQYYVKIENAYEEIKSRHANIIFITNEVTDKPNSIIVSNNKIYSELLSIIPIQLLGYYLAISRDINPDMPRNLAKVVTVE